MKYLKKFSENPILESRGNNHWESQYVFNPAAVYLADQVHLVYRAIGNKGMSVLGYAMSKNGINIDQRSSQPIYIPQKPFESNSYAPYRLCSSVFMSGGGYGGCEDPRLTALDDTLYMTYTAFDGWSPPRVALSSIKIKDFLSQKWNWKQPILISEPGQVNKNWVIFPEKINGKYAVLHSICPEISIAYLDDLEFKQEKYINSWYAKDGRKNCWDNWLRGAGPPPIKTKDGWLLLYHAMDNRDPGRYKLGAMILDSQDPSQELYRSESPLLEPDEPYENEGFKAGVVYACGSVIINNQLFVYYGGADTVVCVATANLNELLEQIKHSAPIKLKLIDKIRRLFKFLYA